MSADTPMMRQYRRLKAEHPDALLFFRLGDFYEMFGEDAKEGSRLLGLTLTSRSKGDGAVPMAGVPAHAAEGYLRKLLDAGRKVAISEQVDDGAEGMMRREVVRVLTPGTVTEEGMLQARANTWIAAVASGPERSGVAWADCSTGEFRVAECPSTELPDFLSRLDPAEVLVSTEALRKDASPLRDLVVTPWGDWAFAFSAAHKAVLDHFRVAALDAFGCADLHEGIRSAGALLLYLRATQKEALGPFRSLVREREGETMPLDRPTLTGLEILAATRTGAVEGSLLSVLDRTVTSMGARKLRRWISAPLVRREAILDRQEAVAALVADPALRKVLRQALREVYDLERLSGRIAAGRASPRDALAVGKSLSALPGLRKALGKPEGRLAVLRGAVDPLDGLAGLLKRALSGDGGLKDGYDAELDRLRALLRDADAWVARFESEEVARTGIPSLKVSRHRVFGWLIDVTNVHRAKIPSGYVRRQTLKSAERYTTAALQEHESAVQRAEREAADRERVLFGEIRQALSSALPALRATAESLSELDALASLAEAAHERRYARPEILEEPVLEIREGRHPVLETLVHPFVPNDAVLDGAVRERVVTGPNMAGKSTFIRQVALIQLMAQIGSFVPAASARLGVADRIFARAGAVDDLSRAQSTFLVEMAETAHILRHATRRTLAVLDEIGRGTSTFDGVSIAWAVAEELGVRIGARTLFATHYHELAALAQEHPGIVANATVAVREEAGGVVFLHRIEEGSADRSYGLHVAALAGVPEGVVARARGILAVLESKGGELAEKLARTASAGAAEAPKSRRVLFAEPPDPLRERLKGADPDRMTPLEALAFLADLRKRL